jgi:peptide/nickel transport system substrate-binding protein
LAAGIIERGVRDLNRFASKHLVVLFVILAMVVVVGCGQGQDAGEDTADTGEETEETKEPEEEKEPEGPSRVVVAQGSGAASWDPPQDWNTAPEWVINNAYDCLLFTSADGSEYVPMLATDWERLDEVTLRMNLREGVKFHDGTDFDAEDVKYHYERIRDGDRETYIVTNQYDFFEDIVIHDPYTLDFVTPEPDSLLLNKLSQTACGIVSKEYVEEVGPEGVHKSPMGTGPWKLKDWGRDEFVLFERNDDYWGEKPEFEEFEFKVIPEPSTRVAELLTGGVDITYEIRPQDKDRIDAKDNLETFWAKTDRGYSLYPRMGVNPQFEGEPELDREFATEDPRVREAIELALNKEELREVTGGNGEPYRARMFEPVPEANPDLYGPEANLYDPDKAKQILEEAGYAEGEPTLVFHASSAYPTGDIARVIEKMLEDVGFTVELKLLDTQTFNTEIYFPRRTQELILLGLGGNMNPFFGTLSFHSSRRESYGGVGAGSEEIDNLLNCAWTTVLDDDKRIGCYHEAQQLIADRRMVIGLFQISRLWGVNADKVEYTPRYDNHIKGVDIKKAD